MLNKVDHSPVSRVMGEFPWVACTRMSGSYPVRWQVELDQFVHIPHDRHIRIQENYSLQSQIRSMSDVD
jgi:hypothetical protein